MRLRNILIAAAGALGIVGPAVTAVPAQAAGITECGNFHPTAAEGGYWNYRAVDGATPVYNLTTRGVRCSEARRFSLVVSTGARWPRHGFQEDWHFHGERYDVRCTRGSQVIHWQGGA